MSRVAVGTIVARNYLAYARVAVESFRKYHPGIPFYVLVADGPPATSEPFQVLTLPDVEIPSLESLCFRYDRKRVAVAAKPFLLEHLLKLGHRTALFLDPDVLVLRPFDRVLEQVADHDLTVTPHFLRPPEGSKEITRELTTLVSGMFNGGFVAATDTPSARAFLHWWKDRLFTHCTLDVPRGLHYDQRWLDFAPAFVEDLFVLADPSYNVAYWNLFERDVKLDGDCAFFHFSGYRPEAPDVVTGYWPELRVADLAAPVAELFRTYAELLAARGHEAAILTEWRWDRFDNGVKICPLVRQAYSDLGPSSSRFGNPFQTRGRNSYFRWLRAPVDGPGGQLPQLWDSLFQHRSPAIPHHLLEDRPEFAAWIVREGAAHHRVAPEFRPQPRKTFLGFSAMLDRWLPR